MQQYVEPNPELALRMVRESPLIAYDSETTGLTIKDVPCGHVITDADNSIYIPVRHEGGGNILNGADFERELNAAFHDRYQLGYRTVGHNIGFDLRALGRVGITVPGPLEDCMINEALINDLTIGYSLDNCTNRYAVTVKGGPEIYSELARHFGGVPDRKQMKNFYRLPGTNPIAVNYATTDGQATLELRNAQQRLLDEEDLRRVWELECKLIPHVAKMHSIGMRIDQDYASEVMGKINAEIAALSSATLSGINVRSPKSVEQLYRMSGFRDEDFARTANGAVSFTERWLEGNPIGKSILAVRRMEKARDSFVTPLIDTNYINGRVHPTLNQSRSDEYGVAGARFSCSEPNLQAFPKRRVEIGKLVRRLVIADEDFELAEADYQQQEPRLFTHYSQEPSLVEGYINGTYDIHDRASEVLGLERNTAKRLGLGMLTMMSAKTLAGHMGWEYSRAQAAHRAFLTDAFPAIGQFQQRAINTFKTRGYVKSILGRRARLDHPKFGYRAVSRIIQNSGGDHLKSALLAACEYAEAHPEVRILLTIHDSVIWQRQVGFDDSELIKILDGIATDIGVSIPIPTDIGRGRDWATVSYGE